MTRSADDRPSWLAQQFTDLKLVFAEFGMTQGLSPGERRRVEDLFIRAARLATEFGLSDAGAARRIEHDRARALVLDARDYVRRHNLALAFPVWSPTPAATDPDLVFFSGRAEVRSLVAAAAGRRDLVLSAESHPGADTADARWRDIRAAGLAVFDLGASSPQVYYDLGIALTLGMQLCLLAPSHAELPFDVSQDPVLHDGELPSQDVVAEALDDATYAVSTAESRKQALAPTLDAARRLAGSNASGVVEYVVGELASTLDPFKFYATLESLGPMLGRDDLAVLRCRWPAAYPGSSRKRCFVVMPFREELDAVYGTITQACRYSGHTVIRGDTAPGQQIIASIWTEITGADLAIVDLTDLNLNVCLELGIADTMGRPTFLIGSEGTQGRLFPSISKRRIHRYPDPGHAEAVEPALRKFLAGRENQATGGT